MATEIVVMYDVGFAHKEIRDGCLKYGFRTSTSEGDCNLPNTTLRGVFDSEAEAALRFLTLLDEHGARDSLTRLFVVRADMRNSIALDLSDEESLRQEVLVDLLRKR